MGRWLSRVFEDKRATCAVLMGWLVLVLCVFLSLGVLQSPFFRFGPSPSLHFMNVNIDTWAEWALLSAYCSLDTLVHSFGHDALVPWLTTVVIDPKSNTLPYSKPMCLFIVEAYYCYVHVSYVFKFFLSLTQFDFVLFSCLSDMGMKIYSYSAYMKHKAYAAPERGAVGFVPLQEEPKA